MSPSLTSTLVKHLCTVALVALALMWVYFLVDIESLGEVARQSLRLQIQWQTVESWQWYGVWGFSLVPSVIIGIGLIYLRRLFSAFAQGNYFSPDNIRYLQRFALAVLAQTIANPLVHTLNGIALSLNHPPGGKILSIRVGDGDFKVLLIGLVLWVITAVLAKGVELQRENRQFV